MSIVKNNYQIDKDPLYLKAKEILTKALKGEDFSAFELINRMYLYRERQWDNRFNNDTWLPKEEPKKYRPEGVDGSEDNYQEHSFLKSWRDLFNHSVNEKTEAFSNDILKIVKHHLFGYSPPTNDLFVKQELQSSFFRFAIEEQTVFGGEIKLNDFNNNFDKYIFPKLMQELEGKRLYFNPSQKEKEKIKNPLLLNEVVNSNWVIMLTREKLEALSLKFKVSYTVPSWMKYTDHYAVIKFEFGKPLFANQICSISGRLYYYPVKEEAPEEEYSKDNQEGIIEIEKFLVFNLAKVN